jgi:hypothetical protein
LERKALDSCGSTGQGRPHGSEATRRLPGTPAESKCLERKSTVKFNRANFLIIAYLIYIIKPKIEMILKKT